MWKYSQLPPVLLARAAGLTLRGRVHFVKDRIADIEHWEDEDFEVFRKVVVDPAEGQAERLGAVFRVRFRFARFSAKVNRILSLIPVPFIVAQPGFRSKTWLFGRKTGAFQGVYEWDSVEDAEKYWTSFPMNLMKRRALPESLTYEITNKKGGRW